MLAKEINFIERFKARASHAAQVQSRVKKLDKIERVEPPRRRQTVEFDFFCRPPRSGEDVGHPEEGCTRATGVRSIYEGLDFQVRRRERWCVMGINGRRQVHAIEAGDGASTVPDDGTVALGGSVKMGLLSRSMRWICSTGERHRVPVAGGFIPAGRAGFAARAGPVASDSPATTSRSDAGCWSGRAKKARLVMGEDAVRSAELPGAGRAHQPSGHGDQGRC